MGMSVRRLYVPPPVEPSGIERHWMRRWGLTEAQARERMAQVRKRASASNRQRVSRANF